MKAIPVVLWAGVVATALACSEGSVTSSAIAGTYVLATVNGESLPAILTIANDTTVVVRDTLALTAERTYTRHFVDTLRMGGSAPLLYSQASRGTAIPPRALRITFTDGVTHISVTATIVAGVITITTEESGSAVGDDPAQISETGVFNKQ